MARKTGLGPASVSAASISRDAVIPAKASKAGPKRERLNTYVSPEMGDHIRDVAYLLRQTLGEVVEDALTMYLAEVERTQCDGQRVPARPAEREKLKSGPPPGARRSTVN